MKITNSDLSVGRVINNDDPHFVLIEVAKSEKAVFTLDNEVPDEFCTLLFVRRRDDGSVLICKPWEED